MTTFLSEHFAKCSFLVFILFLHKTESSICNFNIKLKQTLHNEGFHRNLTYEIRFGTHDSKEMWYDGCSIGLEQVLPSGMYASPDEIEDARYKTMTVFKSKVNIESPAHESGPITVHLLGSVRGDAALLFLPVHARYHRAVPGGGTAKVDIPPPQLFLNCGPKLEQCGAVPNRIHAFCPKGSRQTCHWKEVPTKVSAPLVWHIPVGNTDHHNLVMFGTAAVVGFTSLYLLKEVHCSKLRLQKKTR